MAKRASRIRVVTYHRQRKIPYSRKWRAAARVFLATNPMCACGCGRAAEVVDHVIPHRGDLKLFWRRSNWQGLAKRCHDQKTGSGQ